VPSSVPCDKHTHTQTHAYTHKHTPLQRVRQALCQPFLTHLQRNQEPHLCPALHHEAIHPKHSCARDLVGEVEGGGNEQPPMVHTL